MGKNVRWVSSRAFSLTCGSIGLLAVLGCNANAPLGPRSESHLLVTDGEVNVAYELQVDRRGDVVRRSTRTLTPSMTPPSERKPKPTAGLDVVSDPTINTELRAAIDRMGKTDVVDVVISLAAPNHFSPLPGLDESLPRNSASNIEKSAARQTAFEKMAAPRQAMLRRWTDTVRGLGGSVIDTHVIGSAITARVPAEAVDVLARNLEVRHISLNDGDLPASDADPNNDAVQARALLQSDPYVIAGYSGTGWIGLLDTGVRSTHTMLSAPSPIALESDCYRGGSSCRDNTNPAYSTTDTFGHGTSSAAIISGNSNLGTNWRGITAQQYIDSWKVTQDNGGADVASMLRAYGRVVPWSEWGIVTTMQGNYTPLEAVATGANDLYDLGVAVFASVGNFSGFSRSPANATKVIAVGGYNLATGANLSGNSGTPDGRYKPDLRTPSLVETADAVTGSGAPCDTCQKVYGGSSCAAPGAIATAAALRHYMSQHLLPYGPGNVYATMIAFGDQYPDPTNGSGRTRLAGPGCSIVSAGQVTLGYGEQIDVSLWIPPGSSNIKGAIWWPESYMNHRDIDLTLYDPTGTPLSSSATGQSVFERVWVNGALSNGNWFATISAYYVPPGVSQVVYYYFYATTC